MSKHNWKCVFENAHVAACVCVCVYWLDSTYLLSVIDGITIASIDTFGHLLLACSLSLSLLSLSANRSTPFRSSLRSIYQLSADRVRSIWRRRKRRSRRGRGEEVINLFNASLIELTLAGLVEFLNSVFPIHSHALPSNWLFIAFTVIPPSLSLF